MVKRLNYMESPHRRWGPVLACFLSFLAACSSEVGTVQETAADKNLRRGCLTVREVGWAGSVSDTGSHDPDDDFLELANVDCNIPMDLTGWQLILRGEIHRIYIVPKGDNNIVEPGELVVIAAKKDGAFGQAAQIILPELRLPERDWSLETRTAEDFLIENEMNIREGEPLAGGYDGYTTRSMERTDDRFNEEGGAVTSWHSFTPCNEGYPGEAGMLGSSCRDDEDSIGLTGNNVADGYRARTFASPGESNTGGFY